MSRPLEITYRPLSALKPFPNNARTHPPRQVAQIAESICAFGFNNPVLIDADGVVVAGHGRVLAAEKLGLDLVPTIALPHLSEAQKRAFRLADNKIALNAGWDSVLLATELEAILELTVDLDFDIGATGFEVGEIDVLLADKVLADVDDEVPRLEETPVTREGDQWLFDERHRLRCDDARKLESCELLLKGDRADLVFTDPPYNVRIDGHATGKGRIRHADFPMASGEMSSEQFTEFLIQTLGAMARVSADGAVQFVCMDWRHMEEMLAAGRKVFSKLLNLCVWNKSNAGMGSLYRSKHEFVFVFKNGDAPHINNVELGRFGLHRSNVWDYPGASSFSAGRDESLAMHPTVKPVAMIADAINDCSKRNARVLDGFAGSGSTIIAAERTGRIGYGLELDPRYVDVTIKRWVKLFKSQPILEGTGETWEQVQVRRRKEIEHSLASNASAGGLA